VGLWQAVRRNKPADYLFTSLSFLFYAAPTFFVGTVLILAFAVKLHWFAAQGPQGGLASDLTDWKAMTLPVVTLAVVTMALFSRYMRSAVLDNITDYVQAMKVMGGGGARAVFRHIAPNAVGTIVVNATFQVADAILLVVALSYLGLGIQPPGTDWGAMLSNGIQYVYNNYWWVIYPPGLAIILVVISINFIGDALRDAFEVRLQRR
jgi:ABC-type dipeptide/oligopeptide/nickel transport system permease subunit